jgi:ABC-2 type transport system permease protein
VISAILRAQWLSMRSFRLDSRRRSAIFSIITAVIWYGFWTLLAFGAEEFSSSAEAGALIRRGIPIGLMLVFLYWQLAPILSASLGASLDLKKLLVYPVPHRKLFVIEVLLRVTTCAEMLLILAGTAIGLLRNPLFGGVRAAPRILTSLVAFASFNLLLSAGLRNLLERLLTHKRLREILMLVLVMAAAIPQLLVATGTPGGTIRRLLTSAPGGFWPWTAAARIALGGEIFFSGLILIWWTVAAFAFGRWQFERSLRYDAQATARPAADIRTRPRSRMEAFYRLPALFLPDPIAAIVEKELRALSRTPRFRLVFIMGFSFGLIVWLPITLGGRSRGSSVVADHYLTIVSVYALTLLGQVSYLNTFGFDRSAAQVYFSMPVSIAKALAGKNLAAALFILAEMVAVTAASLLLRVHISGEKIIEAFLVTAIVGFYLLAIGNLSSVHFPRAMNPERVSQGGAASRMQALIFVFYPVALVPVLLAFWARYVFSSDLIFYLILAFAAILGMVVYWIAMESAVGAAVERREKMLMELSRSEGPVATE